MYSLALIIFVVSEKAFEHFPIGSNVNVILGFLFWYEIQNGGYSMTYFNIGPYGKSVLKHFLSETWGPMLN
jgi:hypothetical protein